MKYVYPYRISVVREHTNRYAKVDSSRTLNEIAKELLADAATERFLVFFLDTKNRILGFNEASVGSLSLSVVHPRDIFRIAVLKGANAVVFAHNHPSGDPAPSGEDRECTKRLIRAGEILGIRVLDHIIIGDEQYYSFADAGMMDVAA
jgi:DNA repair protein RadC